MPLARPIVISNLFSFIEMIASRAYLQVQTQFDAIERFFFFIQCILDRPLYLCQWRSSKTHESKFKSSYMKPMFWYHCFVHICADFSFITHIVLVNFSYIFANFSNVSKFDTEKEKVAFWKLSFFINICYGILL
jgi:hypothetical protein